MVVNYYMKTSASTEPKRPITYNCDEAFVSKMVKMEVDINSGETFKASNKSSPTTL